MIKWYFFHRGIENLNSWLFQLILKSKTIFWQKIYCFIFLSQYCLWKSPTWQGPYKESNWDYKKVVALGCDLVFNYLQKVDLYQLLNDFQVTIWNFIFWSIFNVWNVKMWCQAEMMPIQNHLAKRLLLLFHPKLRFNSSTITNDFFIEELGSMNILWY